MKDAEEASSFPLPELERSFRFPAIRVHPAQWVILGFLILQTILPGRIWIWNVVSIIPPTAYLFIPLVVGLIAFLRRERSGFLLVPLVAVLAWSNVDLPSRVVPYPTHGATRFTVFTWNTQLWEDTPAKRQALYAFLHAQDADVYQLHEHIRKNRTFYRDQRELERAFPGYRVFSTGEFVTITRLPVVGWTERDENYLRVDVQAGTTPVTLYNVHLPAQVDGRLNMRRRFRMRAKAYAHLYAALDDVKRTTLVAGDFNTTTSMWGLKRMRSTYRDSFTVADTVIPRTWANVVRWWRIDWTFLGNGLRPITHEEINPGSMSDHWGQRVTVEVRGVRS